MIEGPAAQAMASWWDAEFPRGRNPFSGKRSGKKACKRHGGTADKMHCPLWADGFECPGDPPMPSDVDRVARATWLHQILQYRSPLSTPGDDLGAEFTRVSDALLDAAEGL
jgi:hypothetical protein